MDGTGIGSSFDLFLQEEFVLNEATEVAIKRIVDWLDAEASSQLASMDS